MTCRLDFSLLVVVSALFSLDCVNTGTSLAFSLGNVVNIVLQTLRPLLGCPGVRALATEKHFNLLDGLATGLRVGEEKLNRAQNAEASKQQEKAVFDVAECRWDEQTDGGVELAFLSVNDESAGVIKRHTSQLPMAAMPIPVARVSRDQTSAA